MRQISACFPEFHRLSPSAAFPSIPASLSFLIKCSRCQFLTVNVRTCEDSLPPPHPDEGTDSGERDDLCDRLILTTYRPGCRNHSSLFPNPRSSARVLISAHADASTSPIDLCMVLLLPSHLSNRKTAPEMMESKQTGTFAPAGDSGEIINLTRRSPVCQEENRTF